MGSQTTTETEIETNDSRPNDRTEILTHARKIHMETTEPKYTFRYKSDTKTSRNENWVTAMILNVYHRPVERTDKSRKAETRLCTMHRALYHNLDIVWCIALSECKRLADPFPFRSVKIFRAKQMYLAKSLSIKINAERSRTQSISIKLRLHENVIRPICTKLFHLVHFGAAISASPLQIWCAIRAWIFRFGSGHKAHISFCPSISGIPYSTRIAFGGGMILSLVIGVEVLLNLIAYAYPVQHTFCVVDRCHCRSKISLQLNHIWSDKIRHYGNTESQ